MVGAGHNGLTAAFYLAKGGLKPLVLERRTVVGGAATTEEIAPGFARPTLRTQSDRSGRRSSATCSSRAGASSSCVPIPPGGNLAGRWPAVGLFRRSPPHGRSDSRALPTRRGRNTSDFCATLARSRTFRPCSRARRRRSTRQTAASCGNCSGPDRFRALGKTDGFRLLRWGPMAAADLVAEWFETDLLQGALAARGIFGTAQGPWSAGTAPYCFSTPQSIRPRRQQRHGDGRARCLTAPWPAPRGKREPRFEPAQASSRVLVRDGHVRRRSARRRHRGPAHGGHFECRSQANLVDLVDPVDLDPRSRQKFETIAARNGGEDQPRARRPAGLSRIVETRPICGRLHIGPSVDYLERAFDASKYGDISSEPYLDMALPTLSDPSLAPPGKHVLSVHVQFAPYKLPRDDRGNGGGRLFRTVMRTLDRHAPGIESLVEHGQVITPLDLEQTYGLTGGHIFHGEPSLDQLFTMRPVLGWSRYRTPIAGLFLCGAGTHPGGGITGGSGRECGAGDSPPLEIVGKSIDLAFQPDRDCHSRLHRGVAAPGTCPFGFTRVNAVAEADVERRFLVLPSADRIRDEHRVCSLQASRLGPDRRSTAASIPNRLSLSMGGECVERNDKGEGPCRPARVGHSGSSG